MKLTIDVKYRLKDKVNTDGTRLIIAYAYFSGERVVIYTGIPIDPVNWQSKEGVLTEKFAGTKEGKLINRKLSVITANIKKAYQIVIDAEGPATGEAVKARYGELSGKKPRIQYTFLHCIDEYIAQAKNGELKTRDNKPYSDGIIAIYERTKRYLAEYAKHNLNKPFPSFQDVLNDNFYGKFTRFLQHTQITYRTKTGATRTAGKLNANSTSGIITRLKTFLNASKQRFNSKFDYSTAFKTHSKPQRKVYLTLDELDTIEKLDLSEDETINEVKDWLLITCWTGLRVSDFKRLRPEHFDLKNNSITIDAQKTRKPSYIPLFPAVAKIIKRYEAKGGFLPRPYSDQFLNRKFKEIALAAGITQKVITIEHVGNKMIEVTVPKYSKIFTKTGRTSFISNLLSLGFNKEQIKRCTGHSSDKVFEGYDQLPGQANADTLLIEFKKKTEKLRAV